MIRTIFDLYVLVLIADIVLSYLPQFRHHPAVIYVRKASDLTCKPVRKMLPEDLPLDFSPLIVIFGLKILEVLW